MTLLFTKIHKILLPFSSGCLRDSFGMKGNKHLRFSILFDKYGKIVYIFN